MSLLVASNAVQADTAGQTRAHMEGPSHEHTVTSTIQDVLPTDLGGLDFLFRDTLTSASHVAANVLHKASDAVRGPHGGLRPDYLARGTGGLTRVDGDPVMAVTEPVRQGATILESVLARVKAWANG